MSNGMPAGLSIGSVICPCCGRDVTSVEREIKMELPDAILAVPAEERAKRVGAGGKAFMHLDLKRYFTRALLPVRLSDGHEFHFGVWLEAPEEICRQLWMKWDQPEYSAMRFGAVLANSVPPWNDSILGAPCTAVVRDQEQLPYVDSSMHPQLATVLTTPWPREECEAVVDLVWGVSRSEEESEALQ
jgi:hypothetical protein